MHKASAPLSSADSSSSALRSQPSVGRRILANTSALAASNLWRIVISFVLQLMISRDLGVVGMGYYTIALTYLNICQVISELGLPALLTRDLAQFPSQRRAYFYQSLAIQIGLGGIAWAVLLLFAHLFSLGSITQQILLLVGMSLPLYAVTSASQTLFQAGERLELIFAVETLINTLILAVSLVVLWQGGDVLALVTVLIGTQALSAIVSLWLVRASKLIGGVQETIPFDLPVLWRRTRPFFGLALADVLLQRLDTLLLSLLGNVTITGIYGTSDNLVRVLLKLVQSLWRALYPTLSRLRRQTFAHYITLCGLSLRYGLIVLVSGAALGTVVARDLLTVVYDTGFADYALVLQIAIWTAPAFLIELYAVTVLMVENRPLSSVLITGAHLAVIALLLPLLIGIYGAVGAAISVCVAGMIGSLVGVWLLRQYELPIELSKMGQIVLAASLGAFIAWLVPIGWLWKLLIGGVVDLVFLWLTRALTHKDLLGLVAAIIGKPWQFGSNQRI